MGGNPQNAKYVGPPGAYISSDKEVRGAHVGGSISLLHRFFCCCGYVLRGEGYIYITPVAFYVAYYISHLSNEVRMLVAPD